VAQGREAAEGLKPATLVVAARVQAKEAVEGLKPVTLVVAGERRALSADLAKGGASVLPVIRARRAVALPPAPPAVREGRGVAAAVDRAAAEEDPLEVAEAEVGEQG